MLIIFAILGNIYCESGDMMLTSIFRTIILYSIIITALRIMGKRQISDLQTSELVVTLLISDIASIPMENTSQPLLSGIVPILILVCAEIVLSVIMIKNQGFRRLVCGKPIIVIKDGKIDRFELKRLRMTVEDLFEQLRQADVFSLDDVLYAIIETNGKMSVMKRPECETVRIKDLNLPYESNGIEAVVVSDGCISKFSCKLCQIEKEDVIKKLDENGLKLNQVFIMTCDKNKNFKIIRKDTQ